MIAVCGSSGSVSGPVLPQTAITPPPHQQHLS